MTIAIALLFSCSTKEERTKAKAETPESEIKTPTIAGAKLVATKTKEKADPPTIKETPVTTDYTGYYLPWPKFPVHPRVVKSTSSDIPNLHYGTFHIHTVDHETKTISFSNLAFGQRTEYTASFKMSSVTDGDGKKIPALAARTKQFSFQIWDHRILFRVTGRPIKRLDKLKPFKYNSAHELEHKFTSDEDPAKFSVHDFPNASTKKLKARDLKKLTLTDLKLMRTSIYARHGAAFEEHDMALFFSRNSWYAPYFTFHEVQEKLTSIERKNIKRIFSEERKKL